MIVPAAIFSLHPDFLGDGSWTRESSSTVPESWPTREAIVDFCDVACLPTDAAKDLHAISTRLRSDALACGLFARCRSLLFSTQPPGRELMAGWKGLSDILGPAHGAFNILLLTSELPRLRAIYAERGIGRDVLSATLSDAAIWAGKFRAENGCWGLGEMGWLYHHLRGEVFRLGRLQFMHRAFPLEIYAFAERASGRVVALAGSGIRVRTDGLIDGTNGSEDPEAWTTRFSEDQQGWIGAPVSPSGFVREGIVYLKRDAWQAFLSPGSDVLDIHIPGGEKLDRDACRDSLLRARIFFRRHFPDKPWSSFHLCTWLLDPQLPALLGSGSRISAFQEGFYLLPVRSDESQTYERVFGSADADPSVSPRDTALRRSIIAHVAAGGRMRMSSGIIRPEDLDREDVAGYRTASERVIDELTGRSRSADRP